MRCGRRIATTLIATLCVPVMAMADEASAPGEAAAALNARVLREWSAKHLVMLYRQESASAPSRLDSTVQAATLALEREFLDRKYRLTQASADALQAMDQGPGVIVTFAADAGLSMVYSVHASLRPELGTHVGIAEVGIDARVFVGATLLSAENGHGQVQVRTDPGLVEYAERRGVEMAAAYAAKDLASHIDGRLSTLTPERILQLIADDPPQDSRFTLATPTPMTGQVEVAPPAPASAAVPHGAHRWLVTIGVRDYSNVVGILGSGTHDNDLPGAATDVNHVASTLKPFGFDAATTTALFDKTATAKGVRDALAHLATVVGSDDLVVFYISGHGMQRNYGRTGMTLPLLYDTNLHAEATDTLDFAELVRRFSEIPARHLAMLIDTCHSGGAASEFTTVSISAAGVRVDHSGGSPDVARMLRTVKAGGGDMAVMSAARTNETAIDLGEHRGGLFTSNLLKGLQQTQGLAPLEELYRSYVFTSVVKFCREPPPGVRPCQQSPVLGYAGAGNLMRFADDGIPATKHTRSP